MLHIIKVCVNRNGGQKMRRFNEDNEKLREAYIKAILGSFLTDLEVELYEEALRKFSPKEKQDIFEEAFLLRRNYYIMN